jgi:hypothetical protein
VLHTDAGTMEDGNVTLPTVELSTPIGRLRGLLKPTGHKHFRGIPYAQPPIGALRWRPPQPIRSWNGTLDATAFGHACMQYPGSGWATVEQLASRSEDCLFINVVVPPNTTAGPRPILVYIHAGEFHYGAASDRESDWPYFAPDIVFVTFNFRLGVFGYLASEALRSRSPSGGTGNYGMHDQRQALRWVQEHMHAFGGDVSRVTIMGESSGGTSVGYHLTSPPSYRLFERAILQSPGLTQVKSLPDAELNYAYVLAMLATIGSPECERAADGSYTAFPAVIQTGTVLRVAKDREAAEAACGTNAPTHGSNLASPSLYSTPCYCVAGATPTSSALATRCTRLRPAATPRSLCCEQPHSRTPRPSIAPSMLECTTSDPTAGAHRASRT